MSRSGYLNFNFVVLRAQVSLWHVLAVTESWKIENMCDKSLIETLITNRSMTILEQGNLSNTRSQSVQTRSSSGVKKKTRELAERIHYTCCHQNGCFGTCLLKVRVRNGVITAIEMGDPINAGMPREDVGNNAVRKGMIQQRACVRGHGWRKIIYDPSRLKYPMKNVGERGKPKFERISWEEALDTIAEKIKEIKEKYGPYSIMARIFSGEITSRALAFAPWAGFGFGFWGMSSFSGHELAELTMLGLDWAKAWRGRAPRQGTEAPDIFNSKLIVGIGWNPAKTFTDFSYYLLLAKEKGIPIIIIDPIYSVSAQVYADQWIPIRPGTDVVLLIALANVLFKEDLYDKDFVARFVEPNGFKKWRDYVLSVDDGIDKTPEWAERICGVPAETISELARLYATSKPCYFRVHWSTARQVYGENTARVGMYLQAMTGNIGVPGGWHGGSGYDFSPFLPSPSVDWKREPPSYTPPTLMYIRGWPDAILLREKLENKEISEDEYRRIIGCAKEWPLPNPRMMLIDYNVLSTHHDLNKQIETIKKLEFTFATSWHSNHPMVFLADIALPVAEQFFEDYTGFVVSDIGVGNYFIYASKIIEPPGEAKPLEWICIQLARRLGVAEKYSPRLAQVSDEKWDEVMEDLHKEAYEVWASREDIAWRKPPPWEEFKKKPIYRVPLDREPMFGFKDQIQKGQKFNTPSGKIEFCPEILGNKDFARLEYRERCFGGATPPVIPPIARWVPPWNSMVSSRVKEYPLLMISPHSFYRQNSCHDNNPWLRDEYRHACWISVADAKTRGIKDGDQVHVFNGLGELILPAYVTSRVTPGVVVVHFGAFYEPSEEKTDLMPLGIDTRGAPNFLTPAKHYPWVCGTEQNANLVQVEQSRG